MTATRSHARTDLAIAAGLAGGYLALLLATVRSLGYMRDEGFYVYAARVLELWFDRVVADGRAAFTRPSIDYYFAPIHEHPGLMKLLFAASHRLLHERWPLFSEAGTAYRLPGMLMASLAVAVVYLWGREALGRPAGFVSALLFAFMPRVFFHSHLACLDMATASMWLLTSYVYLHAYQRGRLATVIAAGVLYGVFLDTKHNAWLFPFALAGHLVAVRLYQRIKRLPASGSRVPWALVSVLGIGPLVLCAIWPWLWFDTSARLLAWVKFHLGHDYYNMEFLGRTYWKPPMPRLYAWVMTLATVPLVTLALFGVGLFDTVRSLARGVSAERASSDALWLLGLAVSYAPWLSTDTPIFGGTKHWITAYPFLCLLAGRGFTLVHSELLKISCRGRGDPRLVLGVLAVASLLGPIVMTLHAHPWGLSFYTPLVGGAPGAASLGLNRTFWGYTTGALTGELNRRAPPEAPVYVHDTALQSWELLREDGRVRADLVGTLALASSELALYQHEPHMRRVEYETWVVYGTVSPVAVGAYDGVPVVWLYERPALPAPSAASPSPPPRGNIGAP
jgi:4-amino-4-deoxy-L-arabinose transferase-like glycosyltransferase